MKWIKIQVGKRILSKNTKFLENMFEWTIGLMFQKDGEVLMKLEKEDPNLTSIHTFFCVPLIVAWLDKNLEVIDIQKTKPNKVYKPKKPAMYIFETTNLKKRIIIGKKWKILRKQ